MSELKAFGAQLMSSEIEQQAALVCHKYTSENKGERSSEAC